MSEVLLVPPQGNVPAHFHLLKPPLSGTCGSPTASSFFCLSCQPVASGSFCLFYTFVFFETVSLRLNLELKILLLSPPGYWDTGVVCAVSNLRMLFTRILHHVLGLSFSSPPQVSPYSQLWLSLPASHPLCSQLGSSQTQLGLLSQTSSRDAACCLASVSCPWLPTWKQPGTLASWPAPCLPEVKGL